MKVYQLADDALDCGCGAGPVTIGVYAASELAQAEAERLHQKNYDDRRQNYIRYSGTPIGFSEFQPLTWQEFDSGELRSGWGWVVIESEVQGS